MPFFFNNFIIRSRNEDGDQSGAQEDSGRIPACATRMRRMQQINHRQVKGIFNSAIFNTAMRLICAGICWERWTCSGTKIASNADAATVDWGRSDRHSTPEPIWFCAAETISGNHADISLLHTTHAHTHAHTHTHTHTHTRNALVSRQLLLLRWWRSAGDGMRPVRSISLWRAVIS